ncbi:MAG: hypothetical protein Q8O00_04560, partial [Holophaga sp.]|nr:hypothetical protein [Holophaga sp.]
HASERVLALLDKGTNMRQARKALASVRKVGMNLGVYLITGIPGETWPDVEESAAFLREVRPHDTQISPLAIYPGTRLFDQYRAEGRIDRNFFRATGDAEVFARIDAHTEKALRHLESVANRVQAKAAYTAAEFAEQKQWLGFCAVTNLLCGEAAEDSGRYGEAEAEYNEVIAREPGNTWGFWKRALLWDRLGRRNDALADLAEVLRLAPGNPQATGLRAQWVKGQRSAKGKAPAHGPTGEMKGSEAYLERH